MSCDIHCYVEVKGKDGKWRLYNQPQIGRNYELFARMANVRNAPLGDPDRVKPVAQPRGLPTDASTVTRVECEYAGSDGHSHSWLSAHEVDALRRWAVNRWPEYGTKHPQLFGYVCGNNFVPEDEEERPYVDARLVFWFDN